MNEMDHAKIEVRAAAQAEWRLRHLLTLPPTQ